MDYLDFELEVNLAGGRDYEVASRSPAGETRGTVRFPFDDLELKSRLKDLHLALLRSGGKRRRIPTAEEQAVQTFGLALFNFLIAGDVRAGYDVSQREAVAAGKGLRLVLRIRDPQLAALPWEFLYDPRKAEYVCLSRHTPIVRYPDLAHPVQPLSVQPPLRILGMAVSPNDLDPLDMEREKQRVQEAVRRLQGLVTLTWLDGQTWRDIQDAMQGGPWHIFHFIGHGGFNRQSDQGFIALADDDGRTFELSATNLARLLDHPHLKLVLLNACEGAHGSDLDLFSSTASILVRNGIPSVLAMQYEITDAAAVEFSRSFYKAVARGMSVEAAVSEARKSVSIAVNNTVEWGTPVLYLRARDGHLFNVALGGEQIEAIYNDAMKAASEEDWDAAIEKLTVVLNGDPEHNEARSALNHAVAQRSISELYAEGQAHYQAGRLQEALYCLGKVRAAQGDYRDTVNLITRIESALREGRIKALSGEAEELFSRGDFAGAIAALESALAMGAAGEEVGARLSRIREEQELASLYAAGLRHYGEGRWTDALELFTQIEARAPYYRDVEDLAANARRRLHEEEEEARLRARIDELRPEAERAMSSEDWDAAVESLQAILELDPADAAAAALLEEVGRRKELEELYERACKQYERHEWQGALEALERVADIAGDYKDTYALIAAVHGELEQQRLIQEKVKLDISAPQHWPPLVDNVDVALTKIKTKIKWRRLVIIMFIAFTAAVGLALFALRREAPPPLPFNKNGPAQNRSPEPPGEAQGVSSLSIEVLGELSAGHDLWEVTFSPDGRTLAAVGNKDEVSLWKVDERSALPPLKAALAPSRSIAISPDGTTVASGDDVGDIRLWKLGGGDQAFKTLRGHGKWVFIVAFDADGQTLTSVSGGGNIRRWRVGDGEQLGNIKLLPENLVVALAPQQQFIALYAYSESDEGILGLWSMSERRALWKASGVGKVSCGAFSPDGSLLATGNAEGVVQLRHTSDRKLLFPLKVAEGEPRSVTFSPDGQVLAVGWRDGSIRLWRVSDGSLLKEWKAHEGAVDNLSFSGDGRTLVSGGASKLTLWRVTSK